MFVNVELWSRYPEYLIIISTAHTLCLCSVCPVPSVQVTPIGVTTLYSTFSFFRRKKLLHQVGGTKVAQHGQTRYAHLMEILMWKKYHFQLYTRYGQLCRYYWWHIVCTILSLPAVPGRPPSGQQPPWPSSRSLTFTQQRGRGCCGLYTLSGPDTVSGQWNNTRGF